MLKDVVLTYRQIHAFRLVFGLVTEKHAAMSEKEILYCLGECLNASLKSYPSLF